MADYNNDHSAGTTIGLEPADPPLEPPTPPQLARIKNNEIKAMFFLDLWFRITVFCMG